MKRLGLIALLTILPLCSLSQQDSTKTNLSQKAKEYSQKNMPINLNLNATNQKTNYFYDYNLNHKQQYELSKKQLTPFLETYTPKENIKNPISPKKEAPYIKVGIKIKF